MSPSKRFQRSRHRTMLLTGLLSLALWGLATASPAANVATLQDWKGQVICSIDDAGNMAIQGNLIQNAGAITPNPAARESFLQDPGSGQTLALFALDGPDSGQMKIKGGLHAHNYPSTNHLSRYINHVGITVASFTSNGDLYLLGNLATIFAPGNLTATPGSCSTIQLNWTKNSVNETGFIVECSPNGTDSWTVVATTSQTSYSHTGLSANKIYYYRVSACAGSVKATSGIVSTCTPQVDNESLNTTALDWTTSENNPWFTQSSFSHDGTRAVQSGPNAQGTHNSSLSTTISGPVVLSFWWNVSTVGGAGITTPIHRDLNFLIDNYTMDTLEYSVSSSNTTQADWIQCVYRIPPGPHTLRWVYQSEDGSGCGWLDQVQITADLAQAINCPGLKWESGDDEQPAWFTDQAVTHDHTYAARSGRLSDSSTSTLKSTLVGPGTFSFWWKVSSEQGSDILNFYIDGIRQADGISGEVNWEQCTYQIPAGTHEIKWAYSKDGGSASGSDCGWVDEVSWTVPLGLALNNTVLNWGTSSAYSWNWYSQSQIAHDGISAAQSPLGGGTLQTTVTGPATLSFWWAIDGTLDFGQGQSTLTFTLDNNPYKTISGKKDWMQEYIQIPAGQHTVSWFYYDFRFTPNQNYFDGADCGWLDEVSLGPPNPANLTATAVASNRVSLSWSWGTQNVSGFRVERSTDGSTFVQIGMTSGTTTSYSDTLAGAATQYYYRIQAFNGNLISGYSNVAQATTPVGLTVMGPTNLLAIADDDTSPVSVMKITWNDNSTDETDFLLERARTGSEAWVPIVVGAHSGTGAVVYKDMGLTEGTPYRYRLRARKY